MDEQRKLLVLNYARHLGDFYLPSQPKELTAFNQKVLEKLSRAPELSEYQGFLNGHYLQARVVYELADATKAQEFSATTTTTLEEISQSCPIDSVLQTSFALTDVKIVPKDLYAPQIEANVVRRILGR